MKLFIIGASGLVGGNIMRYFQQHTSWEIMGTYRAFAAENCIYFDPFVQDCHKTLQDFKPDAIIHTGGWTHVDGCEQDPQKSYRENVAATEIIGLLAKELNSKLVYTSTDYVFDGQNGPYTENDPTRPLNVYGQHKKQSEEWMQTNLSDYLILRITNVYGDEIRHKNFIARTLQELTEKNEINFTAPSDQYATPINAWDIAKAIQLLLEDRQTGVYHLGSTDYLSRVQLIQLIARYFPHKNIRITPKTTADIQPPAQRPLQGGLISAKFLAQYPHFQFGNVDQYIQQKMKKDEGMK